MPEVHYSIAMAAQKSGLSIHAIRIWEKRYHAVTPGRSQSNRRRYSAEEVERLRRLAAATRAGHRIGDIAKLSDADLDRLVAEGDGPPSPRPARPAGDPIATAVQLVQDFDSAGLERFLDGAAVSLGQHGLLQKVIGPLATRIGDLWQSGAMTAAHEHFATAAIRGHLLQRRASFAETPQTPRLLVVTPAGQMHELGAALVTAAAGDLGWAATYLGCNLPAAEIASAAVHQGASAVALSIVYPGDDAQLPVELATLRKLLPASIRLIAGGRASPAYSGALAAIGATLATDLEGLYDFLDRTRRPAGTA